MRKAVSVAQPAACVPLPVRLRPLLWKQQSASREKNIYIVKINMQRCIFCGYCEEACPKDAIYLSQTFAPSNYARQGFIYKKEDLLIPNPVEDPEAFAKARGEREEGKKSKKEKE